jgi:hypothetical protein
MVSVIVWTLLAHVRALAPRHPLFDKTILRGGAPIQKIAAVGVAGFEQIALWRHHQCHLG